jgi:cation diffusion facilitator CzcD-associated flavoprotein CzcO
MSDVLDHRQIGTDGAVVDRRDHYCVVGAGSSGLTGARHLMAQGIPVDVYEKADDIGGNWNYGSPSSRVFHRTHLVSSKRLTQYPDFPMPADYPDFPSHWQAQRYLQAYARHFGIVERTRFQVSVEQVSREPDGSWLVRLHTGERYRYGGVVVANGHNWSPRRVSYPGEFSGALIHSADYRTSEVLRGLRVVVVGGGNSGCDIACEAAQVADLAVHSLRRGYHLVPKYLFGFPADAFLEVFLRLRIPLWMRRAVGTALLKLNSHEVWRFGYPRPDHRLWETHLVMNDQLVHFASHGDIVAKPDIARFDGDTVWFVDGTSVAADIVVLATGYQVEMPFIDPAELRWDDGAPQLYLNLFHPEYDNLFVLGLMQPSGGQWQLVDHQARAVAAFVSASRRGTPQAERFHLVKQGPSPDVGGGLRYVPSPRHRFELEHSSYRRRMRRIARQLTTKAPRRPSDVQDDRRPAHSSGVRRAEPG